MSLKEKIENNLTIYTAGIAFAAFSAGLTFEKKIKDLFVQSPQVLECKAEVWQPLARKEEWLPVSQCPAFPLKMRISSPGNGATAEIDTMDKKKIPIPFVLALSRPLGGKSDIGFVVKPKNSQNYFVVFPYVYTSDDGNSYRVTRGIDIPLEIQKGVEYQVRGLLVDKKEKMGDRFNELSQIFGVDQSVMVTDPISVFIED